MTDSAPAPEQLHRFAVELARGAAVLVADRTADAIHVDVKSTDTDLVTEVDRASEQWLVERIVRERPADAVLGEEGGARPGSSGVRWVIDPIDGTVNFVLGIPQYAVSVAAEVHGTVVAGAVCNPVSGELFHARLGGGAYLDHPDARRLTGPRDVPLARAVVGTGFAYDAAMRARQAQVVAQVLPRVGDVRRLGAAALDLCFVAAGRLDAHFEAGLHEWDHAAGGLIAREAGCVTLGLGEDDGSSRLLLTAGRRLAPDLAGLLAELGADEVSTPRD